MKKLFYLLLLTSSTAFAQPTITQDLQIKKTLDFKGVKITAIQQDAEFNDSAKIPTSLAVKNYVLANAKGVDVLETVAGIAAYAGNTELLIVNDILRGGRFYKYSGSLDVDNGVVFQDSNGQKWKREIEVNYIDIRWYGATLSTTTTNDIYSILNTAIAAATNTEIINSGSVYIPATDNFGTKWYYCSQQVVINTKIRIFGDGASKSHIRWANNVGGFYVSYITGRNSEFEGIQLSAFGRSGVKAGIEFKDIIHCKNVKVKEFGMGFYAIASVPTGNVNNSTFTNCGALQNNVHGFYFKGSDANAIKIVNCESVSNGGLGICDQSFLGNHYYGFHSATNGGPDLGWQKGLVKVGTTVYACIYDSTLNIEPGVTAGWGNYWYLIPGSTWHTGFASILTYNAATTYYAVGPWNLNGFAVTAGGAENQYGTMVGCYMEYDQAPAYIGNRCTSFGSSNYYRVEPAALQANNYTLFALREIQTGNIPTSVGLPKGILSKTGTGVYVSSTQSALLGYDTTTASKKAYITTQSGQISSTWFTSASTTDAMFGRSSGTTANGKLALANNFFMTSPTGRNAFIKVDLARAVPPTSNLDYGDLFIATARAYHELKPEYVLFKYLEPTIGGTKKMYAVKGFQEDIITATTGTYVIGRDYNLPTGKGILYDVTFVGKSTAGDNCVIHREMLAVNIAGTMTLVDNSNVRTDYVPGGFATVVFDLNFFTGSGNDDIELRILNLPTGTDGKVNIKRIDY